MEEAQQSPSPSSAKRIWLKAVIGLAAAVVIAAVWISHLIFAPWETISAEVPSMKDFSVQYRLLRRISNEFTEKDRQIPEKAVLELSEKEINSLFRIAGNITPKNSPYPVRYYRPSFSSKGEFSAVMPIKTPLEWLWGGTVYLRVVFTLSKAPGQDLQCRIVSARLTSFPVSRTAAQKITDKLMVDRKLRQHLTLVNKVLRSVSFAEGKLRIEYSPRQLLQIKGQ